MPCPVMNGPMSKGVLHLYAKLILRWQQIQMLEMNLMRLTKIYWEMRMERKVIWTMIGGSRALKRTVLSDALLSYPLPECSAA